ncbi:MAG: hypothetical protein WDO19_01530 [Bacteroidota bacterium]
MVRGLAQFKTWFNDFSGSYVIIGGTACERQFEERGLIFRATKDIDLVLVIEALDTAFVKQFWEFIKAGNYNQTQVEEKERKYYRFANPAHENFPVLIELFSKRPDVIQETEGMHLTPIPAEEDLSSLSAILMDNDYYQFTLVNTQQVDGLPVASAEALIALKASAYINMLQRKDGGEQIDSKHIKKHKNDVLRLAVILAADSKVKCPDKIKADISQYIQLMKEEQPDVKAMFKEMGLDAVEAETLLTQLQATFLTD